ncbi:phospholipase A1-like [Cephus cinctus]|uniref:phospholipase A1 n=1 Tax=Cephus cinctus TaxID=211228 RepID=A0AAJ7R821_CEPCN|nr:phospholipase A1-like [Cephus cinctus]
MKILVLAGYFLVCVALANAELQEWVEMIEDNLDEIEEHEFTVYSEPIPDFIVDDEGNPIHINPDDEDYEEDESVEETASKISQRVSFHVFNPSHPNTYTDIYVNDTKSLRDSDFDLTKPIRIITHGWVNSKNSDACTMVKDAYLANGEYNVIVVDWSKISKNPYLYASNRVKTVGTYLGELLDFLARQGAKLSEAVLVGHSLGAHIVGLAGYYSSNQIGHIVGLDPALPLFYTSRAGSRIAKGDAKHVQIIHTNAGVLGYYSAIGDSDFYPNGGGSQRGCYVDIAGSCSHSRAYKYYAESIGATKGFVGLKCKTHWRYQWGFCNGNSKGLMGGATPSTDVKGVYYLKTSKSRPYAKG